MSALNYSNNRYGRTAWAKQPAPLPSLPGRISKENLAVLRMYAITPTNLVRYFESFEDTASKHGVYHGKEYYSYEVEGIKFVWREGFKAIEEAKVNEFLSNVGRCKQVMEIYHENGSYHDRPLQYVK